MNADHNPGKSAQIRGSLFLEIYRNRTKGDSELQFVVKGQTYFLAFVEEERRWYVFAPMTAGVRRIPVYVDAPSSAKFVLAEEGKPTLVS